MLPGGGDTRPSAKLSCPTSRSTICNPSESIFQNESREESCGNRKVTGIVQRSPTGRGAAAGSISAKQTLIPGSQPLVHERLGDVQRAVHAEVIVPGAGKAHEPLGRDDQPVEPLAERNRHHVVAL